MFLVRELTMNKITCLSNNLNKFFNERANEVSIETEKEEKTERFIIHKSYNFWQYRN